MPTIHTSHYAASKIMTVNVLVQGRAGVPHWNWQISPVAKKNRPWGTNAFKGAGVYAICFDGLVIYVGSFAGSAGNTVPEWQSGDIIPGRWARHVGSISGRSNLLSISPSVLTRLLTKYGIAHPMVAALVSGAPLKHNDAGCQGSINRLDFAADSWATFWTANPVAILDRFCFVYARIEATVGSALYNLTKADIGVFVKSAEDNLINAYRPLINGEIPNGEHCKLTCEQAGPIIAEALSTSLQAFTVRQSAGKTSPQVVEQFSSPGKLSTLQIEGTNTPRTDITPTHFKTVSDAQVLIVSAARFQDSLPFSGAFEVFDLDLSMSRKEDGRLMATVKCTTEGLPLTEDGTLEIELLGNYEQVVGFFGEVIATISVAP